MIIIETYKRRETHLLCQRRINVWIVIWN